VTDESIARCVSDVRKALGDRHGQFIRTLPGRGYLFQAAVDKDEPTAPTVSGPDTTKHLPSIAVLPFVELYDHGGVGEATRDYLGRGITEDMIVRLSKTPNLRVVAGASVGGHSEVDAMRAGRELGVRYVVAGTVRRAAHRARFTVRLVDVATAAQIWAEHYDLVPEAPFDRQDDVAQRIAGLLIGHVRQAEIRAALGKPPERLDAYGLYLRGVAALGASETAAAASGSLILDARCHLQQSLVADPHHAPALISLSVTFMASWGTRRHDPAVEGEYRLAATIERALQAAQQAVSVAPLLAEAHAQLGWCLHCAHRRDEAMQAFARALELNGSLADGRYGLMLTHAGRLDEAIEVMRRAARLNPVEAPFHSSFLADAHYLTGDYQAALALSRAAAARAPAFARIRIWQAAAAGRLGLGDEARRAARAIENLDPGLTISRYLDHVRFTRPEDGKHLAAGLDAAGLRAE
jgi:TolB-like protein